MRKLWSVLFAVLLAACSQDASAPATDEVLLDDVANLAYGAMDMANPGSHFMARLHHLPDSIKLTPAQVSAMRALMAAFAEATRADQEALAAIHAEARAAHDAGKTREEIHAILTRGDAIRQRLHAAEARLHQDILALLTPAQRAWLMNAPLQHPCRADGVRLTEAQHTQITALIAAFESANRTDLDAIKAVYEQARAAREAGATRERIAEILAQAAAPMQRIRVARDALDAAIRALLTPAQLASGCFGRPR